MFRWDEDEDRLLLALGAPRLYNVSNPFDWMEMISLEGRTNFFEKRVGEYALANVGGDTKDIHNNMIYLLRQ